MLRVYGRATSSNVQAVMWAIGEIGLDHERLDYGHKFGGNDTPEYLEMNPHGLVPVLKDGDLIVWESCAILRYLGATYGNDTLWPKDAAARAPVDMWAEWAKSTLNASFTTPIFWSRVRTAAKDRDEAALARNIARFEVLLEKLAQQIGDKPFVMGEHLTMADIVAGHILYRWFTMDIPRLENPEMDAYYARLSERPAFREHVMVPYDVLRAEGA